jgi:hypothetical protein
MERDLSRYDNGKIYSIRSHQIDKYYIGSTCLELCRRLFSHRSHYKTFLNDKNKYVYSFEILKYDDHYIELIEDYPCKTKRELEKREGELQRQYKNDIVNNNYAYTTPEQTLEKQKQYYQVNKKQTLEYQKEYNEVNKENYKQYRDANKKKISERIKKYYEANKEKIVEQQKKYYEKKKAEKNNI